MKYFILIVLAINNLFSETLDIKYYGHFFWEIKTQTTKVYLLGSIHMATEKFYPLPEIIEAAFIESDSLAVEFNINNVDPLQMMNFGLMTNQTLKDVLNEESYNLLLKAFEKANIPIALFMNVKPWLAAMMVSNMNLLTDSIKPELGFDLYFLNKAADQKGIIELESLKEQLEIFNDDLKDFQNEFVKFSLLNPNNSLEMINTYYKLWNSNDIEGLEKIISEEFSDKQFQPIKEALYTKRNYKMAERIFKFFKTKKTYFVVIGAAHLIGKDGVIEILKRKFNK